MLLSNACSKRRHLWKIEGESSIWRNYPTKPKCDSLSRLFIIETQNILKNKFIYSSFNNNGSKLATIDQRGNIFEFDFKLFKCEIVSRCGAYDNSTNSSLCYSLQHDDIIIALNGSNNNQNIHIYECGTYKLLKAIKTPHQYNINNIQHTIINNKQILVSCSSDTMILWDINDNYKRLQSLSHNHSISFGLISTKFESLVSCFDNDVISFWDWNNFSEKYQIYYSNKLLLKEKIGHKHLKLICGDVNDDKGLLIVGGRGRFIYLWVINKQLLLKCIVLPITVKHVIQLKFIPNHHLNIILALGDDGQIVGVNYKTLNIEFYITRSSQFIQSFNISNNSKKISCNLSDGTIEIISIKHLIKQQKKIKCSVMNSDVTSVMTQPPQLSDLDLECISSKRALSDTVSISNLNETNSILSKLSVTKLQNYLLTNNCYADKYRLLIWKFLLNLPNLKEIYKHYEEKGNNSKWEDKLTNMYLIKDINSRSKQRLLKILSLLSNWCILCEDIEFLPYFIYPFIKVYRKNDMDCFECMVSVLCKYCSEWFKQYPYPPTEILTTWIIILNNIDNKLYLHFQHHKIKIEIFLWKIISKGFSSFFNEKDWIYLWDHIITNPPLFFHIIPISILLCCKNVVYSMHSLNDLTVFFNHPQQLYIKNIINKTYSIMNNLPNKLIPTFKSIVNINKNEDNIQQYPIFNEYPLNALQSVQNKYKRKIQENQNDEQHKKLLNQLESEYKDIQSKQNKFALQQHILDYSYKQKLKTLQLEEEEDAKKKKIMSNEITKRRLESVSNIQQTIKKMLNQQNKTKQLALTDIQNQLHHYSKIAKINQKRMEDDAKLAELECLAREKLSNLEIQQSVENEKLKLQRLQQEYSQQEKIKNDLFEQDLNTKNNLTKLQFDKQQNMLSTVNTLQNQFDINKSVQNKLKIQSLLNDFNKHKISSKYDTNDLLNQQLNIKQNIINKKNKLNNILTNQEEFELSIMQNEYKNYQKNIKQNHQNLLNEQKNELINTLKKEENILNNLSAEQRLKHFEKVLNDKKSDIKSDFDKQNQDLQQTMSVVQKQIEDLHSKERELKFRENKLLEKNAFRKIADAAQKQIINEEKEKYANMRAEMVKQMQEREQALINRHKEMMAKLMQEREKQLISLGQDCKNQINNKEMPQLQQEYKNKKKELKLLKDKFNKQQDEIRLTILKQQQN